MLRRSTSISPTSWVRLCHVSRCRRRAPSSIADCGPTLFDTGSWFEMATSPTSLDTFEKGCYCTHAIYTLQSNGLVQVNNTCRVGAVNGTVDSIIGTARVPDPSQPGKLQVPRPSLSSTDAFIKAHAGCCRAGQVRRSVLGSVLGGTHRPRLPSGRRVVVRGVPVHVDLEPHALHPRCRVLARRQQGATDHRLRCLQARAHDATRMRVLIGWPSSMRSRAIDRSVD